jgi:hypothetical protein
MKKFAFLLAMFVLSASLTFAQQPVKKTVSADVITGNRKPTPDEAQLMKREEELHPNIAKSMTDVANAVVYLQRSPDDFGGNKLQAIKDLQQGWASIRKALYYRILEDSKH